MDRVSAIGLSLALAAGCASGPGKKKVEQPASNYITHRKTEAVPEELPPPTEPPGTGIKPPRPPEPTPVSPAQTGD
jgi:hypothetical protein